MECKIVKFLDILCNAWLKAYEIKLIWGDFID